MSSTSIKTAKVAVLVVAFIAFAASLPTGDDTWEEIGSASPTPENMILDAGSGGTKIFAYVDGKANENANLDSRCSNNPKVNSKLGLALLPYTPSVCKARLQLWSPRQSVERSGGKSTIDKGDILKFFIRGHPAVGPFKGKADSFEVPEEKCDDGTAAGCVTKYSDLLLQGIKMYYDVTHPGNAGGPAAKNAMSIPCVATAGMRTIDQDQNNIVWNGLCGASSLHAAGYKIAPKGNSCGTISGTMEAFYEYKSFQKKKTGRGTFTIGGASAQIAFPLNAEDEGKFHDLIATVAPLIKCNEMKLSNGKKAPKFEAKSGVQRVHELCGTKAPSGLTEAASQCVNDYIDIKEEGSSKVATISFLNLAAAPPSADAHKCPKKLKEVYAHCLHIKDTKSASCVAAKAECTGENGHAPPIAGGAQEMTNWAKENCKADNLAGCTSKLNTALEGDQFWQAVKKWFHDKKLGVAHFAYATSNANQGTHTMEAFKGSEDAKCTAFKTDNFDWSEAKEEDSAACIQNVWAQMYVSSFFAGSTGNHKEADAEFGPDADWATGYPLPTELLEVETDTESYSYLDGFFTKL